MNKRKNILFVQVSSKLLIVFIGKKIIALFFKLSIQNIVAI